MRHANTTRGRFPFKRDRLPPPADYYGAEGIKLNGSGVWKSACCPFHDDTNPSLRVHMDRGAFRCHACGANGGDLLDFHRKRHGLGFIAAARALGAWEEKR
jgi:DNA primase